MTDEAESEPCAVGNERGPPIGDAHSALTDAAAVAAARALSQSRPTIVSGLYRLAEAEVARALWTRVATRAPIRASAATRAQSLRPNPHQFRRSRGASDALQRTRAANRPTRSWEA